MPEKPEHPRDILERNVEMLLQRAYRPVEPSASFQRRLLDEMRRAQERRRVRRLPMRTLSAAAAVLVVAVAGAWIWSALSAAGSFTVIPKSGAPAVFVRASGDSSWRRCDRRVELAAGDVVAVPSGGGARVTWPGGRSSADLAANTLARLDERGAWIGRGGAEVRASADRSFVLETPILAVHSRAAAFRVEVDSNPPLPPLEEEIENMKGKTIAAVAAGAALVVTVLVIRNVEQPVVVEHAGKTTALKDGDSGTFRSDGTASVVPSSARRKPASGESAAVESGGSTPATPVVTTPQEPRVTIAGVVQSAKGEPLAGATVTFQPAGSTPAGADEESTSAGTISATSDDDGHFELKVAPSASGTIAAKKEHYLPASADWTAPAAASTSQENPAPGGDSVASETTEPQAGGDVVIVLPHETAIAGQVILAESNEPAGEAMVAIQLYTNAYEWHDPVIKKSNAKDGSFYFGGIDPGTYHIWAYERGYFRSAMQTAQPAEGAVVDGVVLSLSPGCSLSGIVHDKRTGLPVHGVVVYPALTYLPGTVDFVHRTKVDPRVHNATKTDAGGGYALQDLQPGKQLLRFLHPDYKPVDRWVELDPHKETVLDVDIEEGTGIHGTVLDEFGQPFPDAKVIAVMMSVRPDQAQMTMTKVGENGEYALRNLNPGSYVVVRILPPGTAGAPNPTQVKMAQVPAERDAVVDFIEVPQLATLRGRIVDDSGKPVPNMSVTLSRFNEHMEFKFESGITDDEGRFEIRNLQLVKYDVAVGNGGGNLTTVGHIEFTDARDYTKDFTYHSLKIYGRILGVSAAQPEKVAVPGAEILLLRKTKDAPQPVWAGRSVSAPDGSYDIEGLEKGTYLILVRAAGYEQSLTGELEVSKLESSQHHDVTVQPGAEVRVRVTDAQEQPIAGATVYISTKEGRVLNAGLPPVTDENGIYAFPSLPAGSLQATVMRTADAQPVAVPFEAHIGKTAEVKVTLP